MPNQAAFGLIGASLKHSFSAAYFKEKFQLEKLPFAYDNFELGSIHEFPALIQKQSQLQGLNVTFPFKEQVIPYLDSIEGIAKDIQAVNVIQIRKGKLVGHNTDSAGFRESLSDFLPQDRAIKALVLGNGGASKAVQFALNELNIPFQLVSRQKKDVLLTYEEISEAHLSSHQLLINTTPLGTFPLIDACPNLPYDLIGKEHFLFDLVYNPAQSRFLQKGAAQGAQISNGLQMLKNQAELAWAIWNQRE